MPSAPLEYNGMSSYHQDMFYQSHTSYPLQYHLYAPTKYRHLTPNQRVPENFFINNDLRETLQRRNEAALQTLPASTLPEYVLTYHSLVPLDTTLEKSTRVFGYPSWIYKACSNTDGKLYALRRIEGFRLTNEKAMSSVSTWNKLSNAGIVNLKEAFTTRTFGDNSLIFVYDYYPMSRTLMNVHFGPESYQQMNRIVVPEKLIWSYITQLLSAIRSIHGSKLAARIIEPSRILVTGSNRIRLNCCGIFDVLHFDHLQPLETYQQEDILNLGKLLLSLCNSSLGAPQYLKNSLANVEKSYSNSLHNFIKYILDTEGANASATAAERLAHLTILSADHVYDTLNDSLDYNSFLMDQLSTELENGRLFRLVCKMGTINERPEYNMDTAWAESGKRYPLKLFRDYVFHQTDEMGNPIVDLGHMIREMNKLDAGIDESVMLVSRDEQTYMLVTYKELKECMGSAFRELQSASHNKPSSSGLVGSATSAPNSGNIQQINLPSANPSTVASMTPGNLSVLGSGTIVNIGPGGLAVPLNVPTGSATVMGGPNPIGMPTGIPGIIPNNANTAISNIGMGQQMSGGNQNIMGDIHMR